MAKKNPGFDEAIRKSAFDEFMEKGFSEATMRGIAERAGLTTGALYTRYQDKDALFCSLFEDVWKKAEDAFDTLEPVYEMLGTNISISDFMEACTRESSLILDLIYEYYDCFILLFLKSAGSSAESWFQEIQKRKFDTSIAFFQMKGIQVNETVVLLLMEQQWNLYVQIVKSGMSKEEAINCMKEVMLFYERGWEGLFRKLM